MADSSGAGGAGAWLDEAGLRLLAEQIPAPCWFAGVDGELRWFNWRLSELAGADLDALRAALTAGLAGSQSRVAASFAFALPGARKASRSFRCEAQVWHNASGELIGWLGTASEAQSAPEPYQAFLLRLGDRIREESDAEQILALASEAVGRELGVDRVVYANIDMAAGVMRVSRDWRSDGTSVPAHHFPMSVYSNDYVERHSRGEPILSCEVCNDPQVDAILAERFVAAGVHAFLSIPLVKNGTLRAVMAAQQFHSRLWTEAEIRLLDEVADRTWTSVERARAQQELAEAEHRQRFLLTMSDRLRGESDPGRILALTAETLGEYLGVRDVVYREVGEGNCQIGVSAGWSREPERLREEPWPISEIGEDILATYRRGGTMVYRDAPNDADLSPVFRERFATMGVCACITVPVIGAGGLTALLSVRSATPRQWTEAEVHLVEAVAERSWEALERARAGAELTRSREALHQAEKLSALGSLLAGVSHELNNPLTIVTTQASLLEEETQGTPVAARAEKVRRAAERCSRIVQTFLAMARQKRPERRSVDAVEVARAALELTDYSLRTAGVEVRFEAAAALPPLSADPDQLHQVLVNLIVNAQHALQDHVGARRLTIRVSGGTVPGEVCIEVADNGPGIPDALRRRIFEPFFTTKPQGVGTGVGLSFSLGLIEAHGGRLELVEVPEGGACFRITLSAAPIEESVAAEAAPIRVVTASQGSALVVDDEPEVAEVLGLFAERAGYAVETAGNGAEAKALLASRDFDVILSDLRMPQLDGPALHDWIAAQKPHLLGRIGFVTGDTLGQTAAGFIARTGCPVLEKPFTGKAVRALLEQLHGAEARPSMPARAG
jgi:signal transduction histidine kinase/ActR/RegA family two-component response regulator